MLQVDNLSFAYDDEPVLCEVSLAIRRGALVGLLGPNGSGKTTLLRLLAGVLTPRSGRVTLDGADVSRPPRSTLAKRMAIVPQETKLVFAYTVLEMVLMGRYPHLGLFEIEGPRDLAIARAALASTGTSALEARPFDTLSGGEKQRVVIASALAQLDLFQRKTPDAKQILLLDEPTGSLDIGYQLEIANIVRELNAEHGLAIVVSTHDLNFAASLCRELVLLRDGRVLAAGETNDVLTARTIADLYGVEADVRPHEQTGYLTVVPLRRAQGSARGPTG